MIGNVIAREQIKKEYLITPYITKKTGGGLVTVKVTTKFAPNYIMCVGPISGSSSDCNRFFWRRSDSSSSTSYYDASNRNTASWSYKSLRQSNEICIYSILDDGFEVTMSSSGFFYCLVG